MKIIPTEYVIDFRKEANDIIGHIDEKDILFVATYLAFKDSVIWSDDKHFDKQEKILNFKTKDMIILFHTGNG